MLKVLNQTLGTLQISTADALADFAGVYGTFNEAPISDPGLTIIAEVTAPTGKCASYIDGSDEGEYLSVWFTDFVQESGHAMGAYVTSTEFWLQANTGSTLPEYPPSDLSFALFASDGFGNVETSQGTFTGAFEKSAVYNTWLMPVIELSSSYLQTWSYSSDGNLVTATITETDNDIDVVAGSTDAYGNLYLNTTSSIVKTVDQAGIFEQSVIQNDLAVLSP